MRRNCAKFTQSFCRPIFVETGCFFPPKHFMIYLSEFQNHIPNVAQKRSLFGVTKKESCFNNRGFHRSNRYLGSNKNHKNHRSSLQPGNRHGWNPRDLGNLPPFFPVRCDNISVLCGVSDNRSLRFFLGGNTPKKKPPSQPKGSWFFFFLACFFFSPEVFRDCLENILNLGS